MSAKKNPKFKGSSWRLCPPTQYWRNEHVQGDYTRSDGVEVRAHLVRGCCCKRPSGKDQIYSDEMDDIAKNHFDDLRSLPNRLPKKGKWYPRDPNAFDHTFAGWVKYWNDVMGEKDPITPNIVKALAGSESMFKLKVDTKTKNEGFARGIFQLTDTTRRALEDEKGELKDHYVHIDGKEVYDPTVSTAGAVRWLYYKRADASRILKRQASWDEAVQAYKGVLRRSKGLIEEQVGPFRDMLRQLEEAE